MADAWDALETDGFALVPGALSPEEADDLEAGIDRVYVHERRAGRLGEGGSLHLFAFPPLDPSFVQVLDHPAVFPLIWRALGWNIHLYHCHLDVRPPGPVGEPRWGWHQDGGRQNLDMETDPRPRLSLKVAFFLSDASEPGMGNTRVLPGSHLRNSIPRPAPGSPDIADPPDARSVLARRGDAMVFDRRLWHARSDNTSALTRKALFLAYTYRWIRPRDDMVADPAWLSTLSPVQRQLVGEPSSAWGCWMPQNGDAPLRDELAEGGGLDLEVPWLR